MTKFVAVSSNNGATSGVKDDIVVVREWAISTLENTKAHTVYIFEAITELKVAPRTIVTTDLKPTEENTKPDVDCSTHQPKPVQLTGLRKAPVPETNGHDPDWDNYYNKSAY